MTKDFLRSYLSNISYFFTSENRKEILVSKKPNHEEMSVFEKIHIEYRKEYNFRLKLRNHHQEMLSLLLSNQEKAKLRYEEDLIAYGKLGTTSLPAFSRKKKIKSIPLGHPLYSRALESWTRTLNQDISRYLEGVAKFERQIADRRSQLEKYELWLSNHSPPTD